jgi:enamine deaminase RidA (YjgF/YER057c/UK114 family)
MGIVGSSWATRIRWARWAFLRSTAQRVSERHGVRRVTMKRERFASGVKWEPLVGYSRVVRVGPFVYVTGTTATGADGEIVGVDDMYLQAMQALTNIATALRGAGATLDDVVRTRIFVTDIRRWEDVGRAHCEVFGAIRPATTMVEVSRLIDPKMLVEIEVDAVVDEP